MDTSPFAISVEKLSKRYRIGQKEARHDTFMGAATAWLNSPLENFRRLRRLSHFSDNGQEADILWALRDVSLQVNHGEAVGIIGRNGAGKSTLLKVLARITPPTRGRVVLDGRVSSLLEVGTGFHPELTGRENIFLNGTILGMTRAEVTRKFDEIVAFAEVEQFIDTPVKRYSSGMRVRLAFAVAAYLEPDILLVDEVLAVGDAAFQKKCLDKMEGVADQGRTVLFVSHNMAAIRTLCRRAFLLEKGRLVASGDPADIINTYLDSSYTQGLSQQMTLAAGLTLHQVSIIQDGVEVKEIVDWSVPFEIHVSYELQEPTRNLLLGFDVLAGDGSIVCRTYDMLGYGLGERPAGRYDSVLHFGARVFQPGFSYFDLVAGIHRGPWLSRGDLRLRLHFGGARDSDVDFPGLIRPLGRWQVRQLQRVSGD